MLKVHIKILPTLSYLEFVIVGFPEKENKKEKNDNKFEADEEEPLHTPF